MTQLTVAGMRFHPLKSARGIITPTLSVGRFGPEHDHRWMAVDSLTGMFVAQRQDRGRGIPIPEMSQIGTTVGDGRLLLTAPDMPVLDLPLGGWRGPNGAENYPRAVGIWNDITAGVPQGEEANAWITTYLSRFRPAGYRLVRMPDDTLRFTPDGLGLTTYTDGWPFLVISTASLADLNARISLTRQFFDEPAEDPLGWERFRPTIVLESDVPYIEDRILCMTINGVVFVGTTQCKRCLTTTTDQETSVRGPEPLRTLSRYRRNPDLNAGGVVFARNFRHAGTGVFSLGDKVELVLAA